MKKIEFPGRVRIFNCTGASNLQVSDLADYLCNSINRLVVESYGDFISFWLKQKGEDEIESSVSRIAHKIAESRVADPFRENSGGGASQHLVAYEQRMMTRNPPRPTGVLYDGYRLSLVYEEMLTELVAPFETPTIIFTDQLFGTYEKEGGRYHVRVIILGHPCLISTTGLVEGPAKPREYYIQKRLGRDPMTLRDEFGDRFIDYDDPRMTEVMKGYLMQAIFYYALGEPFCSDKGCRLYNAHWQEEVIVAQLGRGKDFCDHHQRLLDEGRSSNHRTFSISDSKDGNESRTA